jgi:serine/threonine protein kinase
MTMCGTVEYMSPEMILRKPYTHKIDVWSLGILLFEMIEGCAPFEGQTQ